LRECEWFNSTKNCRYLQQIITFNETLFKLQLVNVVSVFFKSLKQVQAEALFDVSFHQVAVIVQRLVGSDDHEPVQHPAISDCVDGHCFNDGATRGALNLQGMWILEAVKQDQTSL
jgi:hypothetical protein